MLAPQAPEPPAGAPTAPSAPPPGTVERWAWDYVHATTLAEKLAPTRPPATWEHAPPVRRVAAPGRPPELHVAKKAQKTPGPDALRDPKRRAQLLHAFFHHELQAAELMAWALLAFPGAPLAFRRGLVRILRDEVRHMGMYAAHVAALGGHIGEHPVRDWFWLRVPACPTPLAFVSLVGMGLEGGNLDHAPRFAARFRDVGDEEGARIQEQVAREEIPHVRFALGWFSQWTGGVSFATWLAALPPPVSPILLRGLPLDREARGAAGFPEGFLDALAAIP